ncbi:MAG: CDKL family serine/threonine-protein kinase [archaeon]|nr:CDKL family serine/threonine-protein kinase [archaeon]
MQNKYEVLGVVGEGAYGIVYKCKNRQNGEFVAIKKFKESDDEIVKKTMKRELRSLQMLKHENVVGFQDAFKRKGNLFLVFEFVDKNLLELLESQPNGLNPKLIKSLIYQLCKAIKYLHSQNILHRDIKPENLLITNDNKLKLCDFGFARKVNFSNPETLTDYVATRWYRSPELLITGGYYGPEVDYWAVGCIMGELADGNPLFPGENETDQLHCIQKVLGNLPEDQINMFFNNPIYAGKKLLDVQRPETLERRYMGKLSKLDIDFMKGLLELDPKKRLNGDTVFKHPYFKDLVANDKSMQEKKEYKPLSSKVVPEKRSEPSQKKLSTVQDSNVTHRNEGNTESVRTTNINIININNYGNAQPNQTPNIPNVHPLKKNNSELKTESDKGETSSKDNTKHNGKKASFSNIKINMNNTTNAFKTGNKTGGGSTNNSLNKSIPIKKSTQSNGNASLHTNSIVFPASTGTPKVKTYEPYKTFYKHQNDKYNFNINTNFGPEKKKNNANAYSNKFIGKNYTSIIYEDAEYEREPQNYKPKSIGKNYNIYNTGNYYGTNKKKSNPAAFSMYGNFKFKGKGVQLPILTNTKGFGAYKK